MSSGKFQEFWGNFVTVVIDMFYTATRILAAPKILSSPTPENRTLPDRFWRPVCAQRGWIEAVYCHAQDIVSCEGDFLDSLQDATLLSVGHGIETASGSENVLSTPLAATLAEPVQTLREGIERTPRGT